MVQLFLSKPELGDRGNKDAVKERISFLQRLESIIWSVIISGGRNEARLWLCNTISRICSITSHDQRKLFVEMLRSTPSKRVVAAQLLQMIIEKSPQEFGSVLARKGYILEEFFEGNPRRIMQWFDHFAIAGESGHKKGARAISQFAFVNRDICWEELVWKGKHGQSPAVVATKPHYFHELDILQTVENFLEYVPDFWSSEELAVSVKDGEILSIDTHFFVDHFVSLMYGEKSADIWAVIDEFLTEEEFSLLSQRLLILLDERELRAFLNSICKFIRASFQCKNFEYPSFWLEFLLSSHEDHVPLDEFLLLNSVINQGRQLLRLLADEEHEEEREKIGELMRTSTTFSDADHWALMKECVQMKQHVAIKLIGLHSWILHYSLSKECKSQESFESLFSCNGICFRKSDNYTLVQSDGFSKRSGSKFDEEDEDGDGHEKMRRAKKKRKRKRHGHDESKVDELVEFKTSYGYNDVRGGSWFLSTDGYTCIWNAADLPEQLSRHCFSAWMKWVFRDFLT